MDIQDGEDILFGVFGAGGFAREVMPFARMQIARLMDKTPGARYRLVHIETAPSKTEVNGSRIMSEQDFFAEDADRKFFNIAIGSSKAREEISRAFIGNGVQPLSLFAPSAINYDGNELGEGAVICDNCMITSNARIGKFFQSNIYSYVAHDCEIGDFVTFAPRVNCNGNVRIEDHAYIGTGAVLRQGAAGKPLVIGEGAVVGMGAVVTKDVAPFTTVVGNPARPLQK